MNRPAMSPGVVGEIAGPQEVLLISERGELLLEGDVYARLLPLLDGRRSTDEIVAALASHVPAAEVYYALGLLENRRSIVDGRSDVDSESAAFWHGLGLDSRRTLAGLQTTSVTLAQFGVDLAEDVRAALESVHLQLTTHGDFLLALAADYLDDGLHGLNVLALSKNRPWLLVKPLGTILWIGPLLVPGRTACWECLSHRLRLNRRVDNYLELRGRAGGPPQPGATPPSVRIALDLAALEIAKWADGSIAEPSSARIVTLDLRSGESKSHELVRRPQCPRCGNASRDSSNQTNRVALRPRAKRFRGDGSHRAVPVERTLELYEHHVSPITGVITRLRRAEVTPRCVYLSNQHASSRADSLDALRSDYGLATSGKGTTDAQARASALCEALEHYSGTFEAGDPRRRACFRALATSAVHPRELLLFSERQYDERDEWNAYCSPLQWVPRRLDDDEEIDWTAAWSMTAQEPRYLPTSFCYYNDSWPRGERVCRADSNGNAAGNSLEEAILHGMLELFERDSVALWWYTRARRPAVDLDSFDDPYIQDLLLEYRRLGRKVGVLDLTSDLGVPTFAAISWRELGEDDIGLGFGAHLTARVAVLRALTELNQFSVFTGQDTARARAAEDDPDSQRWAAGANLTSQPHLVPLGGRARTIRDFEPAGSEDLADDVRHCQAIVEARGMELIVLDQTRPDIGLPVAKVIVPGLRHFWRRLAPGRLYRVPLALGWISEPLPECELNPISMFL